MALHSSGCKRQPSPIVFVDPALATLVPADTTFIAGARLQQIHPTPLYQRYVAAGKLEFVEQFRQRTGVDIRKDIWEVVVPFDGKQAIVMLRGKFADMGREPRLEREGAKRFAYKGHTLIGDSQSAVAFLNPTTAIAGTTQSLQRVIDNRNTTTGPPAWLNEQIKQIPSTNQIWFAGKLPVPDTRSPEAGSAQIFLQLARTVETVRGGVDLRSGFEARSTVIARTTDDARRIRDAARAAVGMARLTTPEDRRQLLGLYDRVQVQNNEARVEVSLNVDNDLLDQLVQLLGSSGLGSSGPTDRP